MSSSLPGVGKNGQCSQSSSGRRISPRTNKGKLPNGVPVTSDALPPFHRYEFRDRSKVQKVGQEIIPSSPSKTKAYIVLGTPPGNGSRKRKEPPPDESSSESEGLDDDTYEPSEKKSCLQETANGQTPEQGELPLKKQKRMRWESSPSGKSEELQRLEAEGVQSLQRTIDAMDKIYMAYGKESKQVQEDMIKAKGRLADRKAELSKIQAQIEQLGAEKEQQVQFNKIQEELLQSERKDFQQEKLNFEAEKKEQQLQLGKTTQIMKRLAERESDLISREKKLEENLSTFALEKRQHGEYVEKMQSELHTQITAQVEKEAELARRELAIAEREEKMKEILSRFQLLSSTLNMSHN